MKKTLLLAAASLVAACGGGATNNTLSDGGVEARDLTVVNSVDDLVMVTAPMDLVASAYPPGPYGAQPGDVMAALVWEGYFDPLADAIASTKAYGPYTMDQVRKSGARYALVHISEFY